MTKIEELWAQQRAWKEFTATPLGGAFARYDAAVGRAWVSDCQGGDARMTRDWAAANKARDELVALMKLAMSSSPAA